MSGPPCSVCMCAGCRFFAGASHRLFRYVDDISRLVGGQGAISQASRRCSATATPGRAVASRGCQSLRPALRPLRLRRPRRPTGASRPTAVPWRSTPTSDWCVEEVTTDWCGEIVTVERDLGTVTLEDRRNKRRTFPLGPGFLLEGRPVVLVAPTRKGPAAPTRTASGSVAVQGVKARVARASRIFVEGPARRRARREGVGRRPPDRGRGRGVPRGRRRPRRAPARLRPGPRAPGRRTRRPPGARLEGEPDRRRRSRSPRSASTC